MGTTFRLLLLLRQRKPGFFLTSVRSRSWKDKPGIPMHQGLPVPLIRSGTKWPPPEQKQRVYCIFLCIVAIVMSNNNGRELVTRPSRATSAKGIHYF
ncbi:hypothetical protein FKM82_020557 [Ascaphus truei]